MFLVESAITEPESSGGPPVVAVVCVDHLLPPMGSEVDIAVQLSLVANGDPNEAGELNLHRHKSRVGSCPLL